MKVVSNLCESFLVQHPIEAARALETVAEKPLARFVRKLKPDAAAGMLEHFDPDVVAACLELMIPRSAGDIAQNLSTHTRAAVLQRMSEKSRDRVIAALDEDTAEQTRRMLRFPDGSVAALMDTAVLTLPEDMRVHEAVRRVRRTRAELQGELYVLDRLRHPAGTTTLHALMRGSRDELVSTGMRSDVAQIAARTSQSDLIGHPAWAEHNSIAIVDEDGVFLGVVDHRAVARVANQSRESQTASDGLGNALAVGRLYWTNLTGVLDDLVRPAEPTKQPGAEHDASGED